MDLNSDLNAVEVLYQNVNSSMTGNVFQPMMDSVTNYGTGLINLAQTKVSVFAVYVGLFLLMGWLLSKFPMIGNWGWLISFVLTPFIMTIVLPYLASFQPQLFGGV